MSTIIDHILCNDKEKVVQQGSICIGLSDHNLIYCTRKVSKIPINRHNTIKIRSLKNYCHEDFTSKLENVDWSSVLCSEDVNENWSTFTNVFTDILNTVAPVKEIRLKTRTEPWINSEILELIHERDVLLQSFKKNNN